MLLQAEVNVMEPIMTFKDKVVVVTGGAQGIGRSTTTTSAGVWRNEPHVA